MAILCDVCKQYEGEVWARQLSVQTKEMLDRFMVCCECKADLETGRSAHKYSFETE